MGWARWRALGWDPRREVASGMLGMGAAGWPGTGWRLRGGALAIPYLQRWCWSSL